MLSSPFLSEPPHDLKAISEPIAFDPEKHLALQRPNQVVSLKEIGYDSDFVNSLACDTAYTSAFPILSSEGLSSTKKVIENLVCKKRKNLKPGELYEFGNAAYLSQFMDSLGRNELLASFLSEITKSELIPYVRKHFLAALNIGRSKQDKPVRGWHNDYQSLNLILFLDPLEAHKGGKLQLYDGTKQEADSFLNRQVALPSEKIRTVSYPEPGYAVLIQGSLVKHAVTPLESSDSERYTIVIGYRPNDFRKKIFEYSGIAPDHPMCKYPEAVKQSLSVALQKLKSVLDSLTIEKNGLTELAHHVKAATEDITKIIKTLKSLSSSSISTPEEIEKSATLTRKKDFLKKRLMNSAISEGLPMTEYRSILTSDIICQSLDKIEQFIFSDIYTDDPNALASFLDEFLEDVFLLPEVLLDIQKQSIRD